MLGPIPINRESCGSCLFFLIVLIIIGIIFKVFSTIFIFLKENKILVPLLIVFIYLLWVKIKNDGKEKKGVEKNKENNKIDKTSFLIVVITIIIFAFIANSFNKKDNSIVTENTPPAETNSILSSQNSDVNSCGNNGCTYQGECIEKPRWSHCDASSTKSWECNEGYKDVSGECWCISGEYECINRNQSGISMLDGPCSLESLQTFNFPFCASTTDVCIKQQKEHEEKEKNYSECLNTKCNCVIKSEQTVKENIENNSEICEQGKCLFNGKCLAKPNNSNCVINDPENAWECNENFYESDNKCICKSENYSCYGQCGVQPLEPIIIGEYCFSEQSCDEKNEKIRIYNNQLKEYNNCLAENCDCVAG